MGRLFFLVFCLISASFTGCVDDSEEINEDVVSDSVDNDEGNSTDTSDLDDDSETTNESDSDIDSEPLDSDNDGVIDSEDAFPFDMNETLDSDLDGIGDNSDIFPNDSEEWLDDDNDGLGNNIEATLGTSLNNADSDDDKLTDFEEVRTLGTNPLSNDSDSDSIGDWSELNGWISNGYEWITNPLAADSDSDGFTDDIDVAPTGDAVLRIVFLYWSVTDEGQDFWSYPDPWLRIYTSEDELYYTPSWDNSLEWSGALDFEFDIADNNNSIGMGVELWDSDSESTNYPQTDSSQIMDVSSVDDQDTLILFYNLTKSESCFDYDITFSCEESEDPASGLMRHNLAEVESFGGDDSGSSYEYDSYVYFGIYWEVKNDINLKDDFYTKDSDSDSIPDYLDYNDTMDVGLTITLEEFGIVSDFNEYVNVEVFVDGDSRYFLGQTGDSLNLEGGYLYEFYESFYIDIDDSKRYCVIQIIAYSSGWLFSSNFDLDGEYDDSNVLTVYYYPNSGDFSDNYNEGYTYGADDPGNDYDKDAMLYYSIEVTNNSEYGTQKNFEWIFEGQTFTYSMQLDPETYYYFKSLDHDITDEDDWPIGYTRFITPHEEYVVDLANDLDQIAQENNFNDEQTVNFILSFVQNIDYKVDNYTTYAGIQEYPKYPIEMLWDESGDCEDASNLFGSLMEALGYQSVFLLVGTSQDSNEELESLNHAMIGVSLDGASGSYYQFQNDDNFYFLCETTGPGPTIGNHNWVQIELFYSYYI